MRPVRYNYADSFWCTYVVSVFAANIAELGRKDTYSITYYALLTHSVSLSCHSSLTVTYPLDLTKTRLQIQGEAAAVKYAHNAAEGAKMAHLPHRGMLATAMGIVREEGALKLWQGVTPALYRHVVYSGVRIAVYDGLRKHFQRTGDGQMTLLKAAASGVTAGALSQWLASPADLVKVHCQMEGKRRLMGLEPRVQGATHAFREILARGGVRGLWKGSVPNVQRAALVNLGDLTTYDTTKRWIMKEFSLPDCQTVHIMSSICAGFVAATMGTPADVVKTRVMNQPCDNMGRLVTTCYGVRRRGGTICY